MALWQNVRYAVRTLSNSRGFALTVVLIMALGIGATTAIFSVSDGLLWKPVPLPRMESLVMVVQRVPGGAANWTEATPPDVEDIRKGVTAIESLASFTQGLANVVGAGNEPYRAIQVLTTSNFFDVLGVQPALGRAFQAGDDQPGRETKVVLSDKLWRRRFGADPGIVAKTIRLDDQNFTVTGVMPASFDFPQATELWTPIALTAEQRASRAAQILVSVARLKPGRTLPQAATELDALGVRLEAAFPATNQNRRFRFLTVLRYLVDDETRQYTLMLLGSVVFVLLIACANVANLQFARASGRLREVAVRTALGASRWKVTSQLVTESILLSLAGAALGLLVARWGLRVILAGMPREVARYILGWDQIQLDGRTLAFTLAAAVASGILAGLAPAWQCSAPNLSAALKEGGRGSSAGKAHYRLRNLLVASEIALAAVLLVGAGLMVRGFQNMLRSGVTMEPSTLLTMRLAITIKKYQQKPQMRAFYRQVLERIQSLPGVRSATAATALPFSDHSSERKFIIEGRPVQRGDQFDVTYEAASPDYFATLHVPLRAGRLLQAADGAEAPRVAAISEGMARRWWPNESPLGKRIKIGDAASTQPWMTIVGVVGDMSHNPYQRAPQPTLYVPYEQAPQYWMDIGVRTTGDPLRLARAITAAIHAVDPEQPVSDLQTMEKSIHDRAIGLNYVAALMGVFGGVALLLSALGVYSVMAYLVSEQTHEIGIRMALGAPRKSVLGMIFRRGMLTIAAGLAIGLPLAYGLARLMASLIFGVSATDPTTFIGIPLALLAAAALAIYIPARRAMAIDPIVALRCD